MVYIVQYLPATNHQVPHSLHQIETYSVNTYCCNCNSKFSNQKLHNHQPYSLSYFILLLLRRPSHSPISHSTPLPSHSLHISHSPSLFSPHISPPPALPPHHLGFFESLLNLRITAIRMSANRTHMTMPMMIPTTVPATELPLALGGEVSAASPSKD